MTDEARLPGGHVTGAVRVADTVRRPMGPWSPAVHSLLRHLETVRFEGAPRLLGVDDRGREVLEFLEGMVPSGLTPDPYGSTDSVRAVGDLLRRFHEAVATFEPSENSVWRFAAGRPQRGELICHTDPAPWNVVFRNGKPDALIDWDMAGPDDPIADVAFAAVHFVPLHDEDRCRQLGWTTSPARGERLVALCEGYGLDVMRRTSLLDEAVKRMTRIHEGLRRGAETGDPVSSALWARGVGELPLRDVAFIEAHRQELQQVLT
ncbi:MAG TPA: aminoglycoside phosphotransferase family protein [Actinomycetota bacterium]|nr:aminoglycoside phosphotransferase family protein [Actinomycetota bacterium]